MHRLYFLLSGKVQVSRDDVRIAVIKTPGSVLGEMSVLLGVPSTASVVAMEESSFYIAEEPVSFLDAYPKVAIHMARGLAHRLDSATRYMVDVKTQLSGCSDHLGLVDGALDAITHRDLKDKATPDV